MRVTDMRATDPRETDACNKKSGQRLAMLQKKRLIFFHSTKTKKNQHGHFYYQMGRATRMRNGRVKLTPETNTTPRILGLCVQETRAIDVDR